MQNTFVTKPRPLSWPLIFPTSFLLCFIIYLSIRSDRLSSPGYSSVRFPVTCYVFSYFTNLHLISVFWYRGFLFVHSSINYWSQMVQLLQCHNVQQHAIPSTIQHIISVCLTHKIWTCQLSVFPSLFHLFSIILSHSHQPLSFLCLKVLNVTSSVFPPTCVFLNVYSFYYIVIILRDIYRYLYGNGESVTSSRPYKQLTYQGSWFLYSMVNS